MPDVLIIVDPSASSQASAVPEIAAQMKQAILETFTVASQAQSPIFSSFTQNLPQVEILFSSHPDAGKDAKESARVICPLTFQVPEWLTFEGHKTFSVCASVERLRQTVAQWSYSVGKGECWLPIVLTAKGPLYAEAIALQSDPSTQQNYTQPLHLVDAQRQPLYELGHRLLSSVQAHPSVYLMQFGYQEDHVWFDRLIPFPDAPAIASVQVQRPNLFTCHWYCLTNQPIRELSILSTNTVVA